MVSAYSYLLTLPSFTHQGAVALQPGLERIRRLTEAMGRPHEAYPTVHVAGTNGKGSTASLIAAIATAAGRRVGLHTSPHLYHVGERMRIDGVPASDAWLDAAVERFRPLFDEVEPSFFEATVALSFLYFAEHKADLSVIEVGLGGRLDATNVIQPELCLITNIGLEHTDLLGDTLAQIAGEKAGIIKSGVPVLTAADQAEALEVIRTTAAENDAPLHTVQEEVEVLRSTGDLNGLCLHLRTPLRTYDNLTVGLTGGFQVWNAVLALRAAELLMPEVRHDSGIVYRGMQDVRHLSGLRGRMDVLRTDPTIIADVGHNADGLAAALRIVRPLVAPEGRLFVLIGVMRDKDVARMAGLLRDAEAAVFTVSIDNPRAWPATELADKLQSLDVDVLGSGGVAEQIKQFEEQAGQGDVLLVTGSHQVVSQIQLTSP
jgi:dihydrofolate synthase / folylpolyglutamate synthase